MDLYVISGPGAKKLRWKGLICLTELKPHVGRFKTIVELPVTVLAAVTFPIKPALRVAEMVT